jgi:hypothetical protein
MLSISAIANAGQGTTPNGGSFGPALSTNGQFAAFSSQGTNLVSGYANNNNGDYNVYLFNQVSQTTTLVSHDAVSGNAGTASGNGGSFGPLSISGNGQFIVYMSKSTDLVTGEVDTNGALNIYLYNSLNGTNTLVSKAFGSTANAPITADADSSNPVISRDGKWVAFESSASNLIDPNNGGSPNVYLYNVIMGTTSLVSHIPGAGNDSITANGFSDEPVINDDGSVVAYRSSASILVVNEKDVDNIDDVYVYSRSADKNTLVSHANGLNATTGDGYSQNASLSGDGNLITYYSASTDLIGTTVTNGGTNIYLYNQTAGTTTLVTHTAASGTTGTTLFSTNGGSFNPVLSDNGQSIVYYSDGTDLTAGEHQTKEQFDVFVYSVGGGTNTLITHSTISNAVGNGSSSDAVISDNGSVVAFDSDATNLEAGIGDTNNATDVYRANVGSGVMLMSHTNSSTTTAGNGVSAVPALTGDGGNVVFQSAATNLVASDTNNVNNLYGWTQAVSLNLSGPKSTAAGVSFTITVSAQDRFGQTDTNYNGTLTPSSTDLSAVLPSSITVTNGKGTFATTLKTIGTQTISVTDGTNKGSLSITVTPGPAVALVVSGFPKQVSSGMSASVSVTAQDSFGNFASGYDGSVKLTSSDAKAIFATNPITVTNGQGTVQATLETAGSQSLTATDMQNSALAGSESGIVVQPGPAIAFGLSFTPNPEPAGVPGSLQVMAEDAAGNRATSYNGTIVVTSSDPQAVLPLPTPLTNGIGLIPVTLETMASQTITATDSANHALTATITVAVTPAVPASIVITVPSAATAGTAVALSVRLLDSKGNPINPLPSLSWSSPSDLKAQLPGNVAPFSVTFETAGSQTITATDAKDNIRGSATIVVVPGPTKVLMVSGFANGAFVGIGGTITVIGEDVFGNPTPGYAGIVDFSSTDPEAVLPPPSRLANGKGTFSATLNTASANSADTRSITVTDSANSAITGTLSGIIVGDPDVAFVKQVFADLLERQPDGVTLNAFVSELHNGMTQGQVAAQILGTQEFDNDLAAANPVVPPSAQNPPIPVLEGFYEAYLNRAAIDSQGIVDALQAGTTIEQAQAAILGSEEYYQLVGGTPAAFIKALYLGVLNRPVDPQTFQILFTGMTVDEIPAQAVAGAVLASLEYQNDLCGQYYLHFLGRANRPGEDLGFVAELHAGEPGADQTVIAQFMGSAEYLNRAASLQTPNLPQASAAPLHPVVTHEPEGPFQSPFATF